MKYLDKYIAHRQWTASYYDQKFLGKQEIIIPFRVLNSTHVFHQYTLKVPSEKRDELQKYLQQCGIPSMIYYPLPLFHQEAFRGEGVDEYDFIHTKELCKSVISLPIHTETNNEILDYICTSVLNFFLK